MKHNFINRKLALTKDDRDLLLSQQDALLAICQRLNLLQRILFAYVRVDQDVLKHKALLASKTLNETESPFLKNRESAGAGEELSGWTLVAVQKRPLRPGLDGFPPVCEQQADF